MTAAPQSSQPVHDALRQAKAALIKIRACSIAGCEFGYGKPEIWGDALFASHGDVATALMVIDAVLSTTPEEAFTAAGEAWHVVVGYPGSGPWDRITIENDNVICVMNGQMPGAKENAERIVKSVNAAPPAAQTDDDERLYRIRNLIASHMACETDCQKMPSGCGCALTAARAVVAHCPHERDEARA